MPWRRPIWHGLTSAALLLTALAPAVHADEIYWGAFVDRGAAEPGRLDAFEARVGKRLSLVQWGEAWARNGSYLPFQSAYFENVRLRGAIPVLDWSSWDYAGDPKDQPRFRLSAIANGEHDAHIAAWAKSARAWGHPFFLRFDPEMNGWWTAWSEQANGNAPGDFVRAWRHVVDVFRREGATNATWVWCPNIVGPRSTPMGTLYPGDAYVDWTCMDGYNWGSDKGNSGYWSFAEVFKGSRYTGYFNTYDEVRKTAPGKPVMVGETAASEHGGSKPAWISDMLSNALPAEFPDVKAVLWFDWDTGDAAITWPLLSSPDATRAFAAGIASPYYAGNRFAELPAGVIQPLVSQHVVAPAPQDTSLQSAAPEPPHPLVESDPAPDTESVQPVDEPTDESEPAPED